MSVAAVVVSFNRLGYLKKCLGALEQQSRPLDEIIVVENGSTDGSADYIRQHHPEVTLFETGTNLGGAGGFAWGVELALQKGHSLAWLMDDDAEPDLEALAPLVEVMESEPRPAFAAALVQDHAGNVVPGNLPTVASDAESQLAAQKLGLIAATRATFVGVLVDLQRAATTPLPYADFFIWFDDAEYTQRLARSSFGVLVSTSKVRHPNNAGALDMGWRLYYFLRNSLWVTRLQPQPWPMTEHPFVRFVGLCLMAVKQLRVADNKKLWLSSTCRGLAAGIFKMPRVLEPGDLWRSLGPERQETLSGRS